MIRKVCDKATLLSTLNTLVSPHTTLLHKAYTQPPFPTLHDFMRARRARDLYLAAARKIYGDVG